MMTNLLLYVVTVLIWGSTWFAIEFQLGVVAIEVSLAYRYLLAAALAFAWCLLRGESLRFDWSAHRYFLLLGAFLFGFNYLAAYSAQIYITSALNAIGFSAMLWMNIVTSINAPSRDSPPRPAADHWRCSTIRAVGALDTLPSRIVLPTVLEMIDDLLIIPACRTRAFHL